MIDQNPDELTRLETKDLVLSTVKLSIRTILDRCAFPTRLPGLRLFFVDFPPSSNSSRWYTETAKTFLVGPTIVVNAAFLLEMETALRSLNLPEGVLSSPYFTSDGDLFGLIKRIRRCPPAYLRRLRRLDDLQEPDPGRDAVAQLTLLVLFVVAHEIGHVLTEGDERHYGTFLKANAPLEDRKANAVVKLCRHAREFHTHKFGLWGFEGVAEEESAIATSEQNLRSGIQSLYINHSKWFEDEIAADLAATEILISYLRDLSTQDEFAAELRRHQLIAALFGVALYSWHKDLLTFYEHLGLSYPFGTRALVAAMMTYPDSYTRAASLFGDVHRFTLLRASLTIQAVRAVSWSHPGLLAIVGYRVRSAVRSIATSFRSDAAARRPPKRTPELDASHDVFRNRPGLRRYWRSQDMQRDALLRMLMDTPVKIAHFGCATGWIKEIRKGRPQLFMMEFDSITAAVQRTTRYLQMHRDRSESTHE